MKDSAIEFLQLCAAGRATEAFERYVGEGLVHHNPNFKGDPDSLRDAMNESAVKNPAKEFRVLRAIEEGDQVAVHSRITMPSMGLVMSVVHIARFRDGKIIEMWDIGQAVPEQSPNENGMF